MAETHWLEKAVAEMRRVPSAKARWTELKHRLVDAQTRILDEMTTISHSEDISELVEKAQKAVSGMSMPQALRQFAFLTRSPSPAKLKEEAQKAIAENPLSSIFASTTYDSQGKPVHKNPGSGPFDEEGAGETIRAKIAFLEKLRRAEVSSAFIRPIRQTIMVEHCVDESALSIICNNSMFVPPHRAATFVNGLLRFMQGDMTAALHTLVPQLENSLRHLLRLKGHDVIKLNDDMTQEDLGLTQMLARLRPELNDIFGEAIVTEVENVFLYRGGPQLRDRVSHGLVSEWEPYGDDAVYACWLILHLCCLPLIQNWDEVDRLLS